MSLFLFRAGIISRSKNSSLARLVNYISGQALQDTYTGMKHYRRRNDILYYNIYLPSNAPPDFSDLQTLCANMDNAEKRKDSQTGRLFIAALPNELSPHEQTRIVDNFITKNFVNNGLCAIAAIHKGENSLEPSRNNPHVHIIVSTRTVDENGFNAKKDREHNKREYLDIWREQWALEQNRAYERNNMDIRVSHKSLEVQGIDREPLRHLDIIEWNRELRGERTPTGDKNRCIMARNEDARCREELHRNSQIRHNSRSRSL